MNSKQARKAKRHFHRTSGPKLMELRLLGAHPKIVAELRHEASMPSLQRTIKFYRGTTP